MIILFSHFMGWITRNLTHTCIMDTAMIYILMGLTKMIFVLTVCTFVLQIMFHWYYDFILYGFGQQILILHIHIF